MSARPDHSKPRGQATKTQPSVRESRFHISLPEALKQFVDGQISTGRYSNASVYVRELIRADQKRKAEEQLEAKLLEGLNSADSELTPADWSALRKEALDRFEVRKQPH